MIQEHLLTRKKDFIVSRAKFAFVIDVILPKIEEMLLELTLEKLIVISPYESMPKPLKLLLCLRNKTETYKEKTL